MWELKKWYQKTVYVIGWVVVGYWALAFLVGLIMGIIGNN